MGDNRSYGERLLEMKYLWKSKRLIYPLFSKYFSLY